VFVASPLGISRLYQSARRGAYWRLAISRSQTLPGVVS
jgi:hypothetical protein